MILDLNYRKRCTSNHVMETTMMRLNPSSILVDGKIAKTSEFEAYSFTDYAKQFTSSDFSISNLSRIGATDLLNMSVTMSMSTNAQVADNLEHLAYVETK